MRFGSVCSGIEAASVAWEPLGWSAAWFAEIEAFPSAVLAHHWPDVPNLGDMTQIAEWVSLGFIEAPDVLVGGTPCQAFSVAGARQSLDDERGQLSLEYIKLANAIDGVRGENDECVIVWENVPGVLNTKDNAFGCFLGALAGEEYPLEPSGGKWTNAGCVFGPQRAIAWRVLDAQYFGVAQRRRRVFVVASARKGFDPTQVLFEFDGVRRDSPPSRETGQDIAGSTGSCPKTASGYRMTAFGQYADDETASTMKQRDYKDATDLVVHGTQDPIIQDNQAFPLGRNQGQENVVLCMNPDQPQVWRVYEQDGIAPTLQSGEGRGNAILEIAPCQTKTDRQAVSHDLVRRLTPLECERLQGFPDNHTQIPYRNKSADQCPDGPRYMACGNSMAVPVMHWIGKRIDSAVNTK